MASNFNFTTKLGLDSTGFKQGVNRVRGSLSSLKSSFLSLASALGAGLGLGQLISNLKNTATELSVAMNTLKNVSYQTKVFRDGTEEINVEITNFQENLAFVRKLSKDYAQDLIAVTDNYAKFTAACKKTALSLEDQRMVFEALTKAAAYYHLSADRTKDMMNAVTQMMSKGKVTAEELRRQLGNTLPGAFNLMAAAMGVSNAELDKMMRDGKVVAADVLPKFAAMLNSITQTAEFDSLQSSLNKFKNTWYEVVEASNAENIFKGIIDGGTRALSWTADNMKGIKSSIVGLLTYIASVNLFGLFERQGAAMVVNLEKDLNLANKKLARFYSGIKELEKQNAITKSKSGVITPLAGYDASSFNLLQIQQYNNQLLETARLKHKLGTISKAEYDIIQKEVHEATVAVTGLNVTTQGAAVSAGRLKTAWAGVGNVLSKAGKGISSFFKANWVFLLISALVSVWNYLSRIKQEAKEIAAISENYAHEIEVVKETREAEAAKLKNNLAIVKDLEAAESARILALKEINKTLGLVGEDAYDLSELDNIKGKYDEITLAVERWIEATKKQAIIQAFAGQIADATAKKADAESRKKEKESDRDYWGAKASLGAGQLREDVDAHAAGKYRDAVKEIEKINNEISEYEEAIAYAEAEMKKYGVELGDFFDILNTNGGSGGGPEGLAKIMEDYKKDTKELANQLKEGAITQDEYNDELLKIVENAYKAAAATGELSLENILSKENSGKALLAMEKWYKELAEKAKELTLQKLLKEGFDETIKSIDEEIEEMSKVLDDEMEKEMDKQSKKLDLGMSVSSGDYDTPSRKTRETWNDYTKTTSDKVKEEYEVSKDYLEKVQDLYRQLNEEANQLGGDILPNTKKKIEELSDEVKKAKNEAETLEAAFQYQKILEDIEEVKKEIGQLAYSGVKDFADGIDRVVSAWDNLQKTMDDSDASGWEKFMAVFNLMTQTIDSAMAIWQTITSIQELSNKLGATKIAEQAALNALLKEEAAIRMAMQGMTDEEIKERLAGLGALIAEKGLIGGILGLKQQEAAQTATNTALKGAEAAASTAAASASAGDAVASATASGAKMPFPYNLLAIAAGVAAVVGALAMMSKFEKGGIVGGSSTHGDHNLVRVNSQEMILNKAQQGTLYRAIASGNLGGGGGGEWRVRGTDLIKVINNTQNKIRG